MKTILVVDDEYALVETLADLLEDEGYRVISAANGDAGLSRLEEEKPDLILTDFMMPIADGLHLIRGVRAIPECRDLPIVMMSSVSKSVALSLRPKGDELHISGYLDKPFQLDELLELVQRLIGKGETKTRKP